MPHSTPRLKPHRRYPLLSIDTRLARAAAEEEDVDFDLGPQVLRALATVEPDKVVRVRVWVFDASAAGGDEDDSPLLFLYLESPRGAGKLASTLAARLNKLWGGGCRYEASEAPSGEEVLRWERDRQGTREVGVDEAHPGTEDAAEVEAGTGGEPEVEAVPAVEAVSPAEPVPAVDEPVEPPPE